MGIRYLWDTNVVIYCMQRQYPPQSEVFLENITKVEPPIISVITEIELLCWNTENLHEIQSIKDFIQYSMVIELDSEIKYQTAEIGRKHKTKLADSMIAASAIVYNLTLLTRNIEDFERIDNVVTFNPHSLENS